MDGDEKNFLLSEGEVGESWKVLPESKLWFDVKHSACIMQPRVWHG